MGMVMQGRPNYLIAAAVGPTVQVRARPCLCNECRWIDVGNKMRLQP